MRGARASAVRAPPPSTWQLQQRRAPFRRIAECAVEHDIFGRDVGDKATGQLRGGNVFNDFEGKGAGVVIVPAASALHLQDTAATFGGVAYRTDGVMRCVT